MHAFEVCSRLLWFYSISSNAASIGCLQIVMPVILAISSRALNAVQRTRSSPTELKCEMYPRVRVQSSGKLTGFCFLFFLVLGVESRACDLSYTTTAFSFSILRYHPKLLHCLSWA